MSEVTLYQHEACPYSHRVRHLLSCHGVSYRIMNVPAHEDDRDELERISGQRRTPVLVVDGQAYADHEQIGAQIARRWPADERDIGACETWATPVAIARMETDSLDDAVTQLGEALAEVDVRLQPTAVDVPYVARAYLMLGSYVDDFVELEPRMRPLLPLRMVLAEHANGLNAQFMKPQRVCMPFRNLQLLERAEEFEHALLRAVHDVAENANV